MGCGMSNDRRTSVQSGGGAGVSARKEPGYIERKMARRNDEIDAALADAHKKSNIVKILLLGAGESGKSTVLKQMRLLHGSGFTNFERTQYSKVIWSDTVQSMRTLIQQAGILGVPLDCDEEGSSLYKAKQVLLATDEWDIMKKEFNPEARKFLSNYRVEMEPHPKQQLYQQQQQRLLEDVSDEEMSEEQQSMSATVQTPALPTRQEVAQAIHDLWTNDNAIRRVYDKANLFQLEVNAKHYFDQVFDFSNPSYKATDTDILVGRIKTTGIFQTMFKVNGTPLRMFDVGGQRSERRKWIHCFDNVTAVLFVAAVSEYDEVLFEDEDVNRMNETLELFEQICDSKWFRDTPIILFLNKIDILKTKLVKSNFVDYHPNFHGNRLDTDQVCNYLEHLFVTKNKVPTRPIYVHRTCATDTESMGFVMSAVTDMIFQKNLTWSGVV